MRLLTGIVFDSVAGVALVVPVARGVVITLIGVGRVL